MGSGLDLKRIIEAVLFAHARSITIEELAKITNSSNNQVVKALEELSKDYNASNSAIMVVKEGNSWKMNVRESFMPFVRQIVTDLEMSKPMLQTLAVIAWKPPIKQSEVVRLRSNKAYEHIKELENLNFISKERSGRTFILKPTQKFYQYFEVVSEHELKTIFDNITIPKPKQKNPKEEKPLLEIKKQVTEDVRKEKKDIEKELKNAKEFLKGLDKELEGVKQVVDQVSKELPTRVEKHETGEKQEDTKDNNKQETQDDQAENQV